MHKSGMLSAVFGVVVLACGGTALAATTQPMDDTSAAATRYTEALNLLEAKGYINFTNFHKAGNDFAATVKQSGRSMTVMIDPDNNTVRTAP